MKRYRKSTTPLTGKILLVAGLLGGLALTALIARLESDRPRSIAIVGTATSILLAMIMWLAIRGRALAVDLAREHERRYNTLMDEANAGILLVGRDRFILEANRSATEHLGYTIEELKRMRLEEVCPPESAPAVIERFEGLLKNGSDRYESSYCRKDGMRCAVEVHRRVMQSHNGQIILCSAHDITERITARQVLQESESRFRSLFENTPNSAVLSDPETARILDCNVQACSLHGFSRDELIGQTLDILRAPEGSAMLARHVGDFLRESQSGGRLVTTMEGPLRRKDGSTFAGEVTLTTFYLNTKRVMLGIGRDITERKHVEQRLERAAREKAVLLKEVHHRVKNNLNVVASLLSMQSAYVKVKEDEALFDEARDRIIAMSRIHEKLYQSESLAAVDFGTYLREVAQGLSTAYSRPDVSLRFELETIELGLERALPLGLILNELVSNCYKYAFPGGRGGEIHVGLRKSGENTLLLSVRDDGAGLPPALDVKKPLTLGLNLINILTEQIDGVLDVDRHHGTAYTVTFPE